MTAQGKPDRCPRCGSTKLSERKEVYSDSSLYDFRECPDQWHSSPVPASAPQQLGTCPELRTPHAKGDECGNWTPIVSAPQAESVPSGKDAAREWLQREHSAFVDAINHGCVILPEDVASKCEQYAASQTAALRSGLLAALNWPYDIEMLEHIRGTVPIQASYDPKYIDDIRLIRDALAALGVTI